MSDTVKRRRTPGDAENPIAETIRNFVQEQIGSWTCERVGYEMQRLGHPTWSAAVVSQFTVGRRQVLTVDEAVALLAVFKSKTRMLEKEIDRLASELSASPRH